MAIAEQTRAQALDVTNRAARTGATVSLLGKAGTPRPAGLHPAAGWVAATDSLRTYHGVLVATTARWLWTPDRVWTADVLLVDEAWQLTWADLGGLGPLAGQVILVGDPGQIAPVVTGDASRWQWQATGPQQPAPDALSAAYPDLLTRLRLPRSWRLGPDTTALIQPAFYPTLPFTSARPPRHLSLAGHRLPEIAAAALDVPGGPGDPRIPAAAAAQVHALLTAGQLVTPEETRPLRPADIAVVAPHVGQASMIAAHLVGAGGVLVATTNQAQGLERDAVVVVHPLTGYRDVPDFAADPDRLCVALSRHRTHAHVLHDAETGRALTAASTDRPGDSAIAVQRHVLSRLTEHT